MLLVEEHHTYLVILYYPCSFSSILYLKFKIYGITMSILLVILESYIILMYYGYTVNFTVNCLHNTRMVCGPIPTPLQVCDSYTMQFTSHPDHILLHISPIFIATIRLCIRHPPHYTTHYTTSTTSSPPTTFIHT